MKKKIIITIPATMDSRKIEEIKKRKQLATQKPKKGSYGQML